MHSLRSSYINLDELMNSQKMTDVSLKWQTVLTDLATLATGICNIHFTYLHIL